MPFLGANQPLHMLLTLVIVLVVFGVGKIGQVVRNLISRSSV